MDQERNGKVGEGGVVGASAGGRIGVIWDRMETAAKLVDICIAVRGDDGLVAVRWDGICVVCRLRACVVWVAQWQNTGQRSVSQE